MTEDQLQALKAYIDAKAKEATLAAFDAVSTKESESLWQRVLHVFSPFQEY